MIRFIVLASVSLLFAGCSRNAPLKPLSLEEIPSAISNAFKPARMLVRQNAESIATQVSQKQYAVATVQLQAMLPQELTAEQRQVASASLMTLNQILEQQAAAAEPAAPDSPKEATIPKTPVSKEESQAAAEIRREYNRTK
jgi:hypothetical protein